MVPGAFSFAAIVRAGSREKDETWHLWWNQLAPGKDHALPRFYGKGTPAIGIDEFRRRYFEEMARANRDDRLPGKEVGCRQNDHAPVLHGLHARQPVSSQHAQAAD